MRTPWEAPRRLPGGFSIAMQHRTLRWFATPTAITVACAAGLLLYVETAFGIGFGAGLRCLSGGKDPGTCMTQSENIRFWSWAVVSAASSGLASVLLAVIAAPEHRGKVRLIATLVPPIAWAWFCDWDLSDLIAAVLVASALAGGLIAWHILPGVLMRMPPNNSPESTGDTR
jgi:hypothetical protein